MPLKTFEGASVGSLLAQIRTEMGSDAVILEVAQRARGVALTAADPETARGMTRPSRPVPAAPQPVAAQHPAPSAPTLPWSRVSDHDTKQAGDPGVLLPASASSRSRRAGGPLTLAFVGPTGAGKTTTIAKLAAHPRAFGGATVGILNLDTYRVGASQQVAQYAALSGTPTASAHSATDLPAARRALRQCEVVLVDCPGRGPQLHRDLTAVNALLDTLGPSERHLVMPVGTQPALVRRTIAHFAALQITHLLATKVDEMPDDWILFDVAAELGLPMRWLADGQSIPQDLRSATARRQAAATGTRGRARASMEGVA